MQKRKRLSRLAAICLSGAVLLQASVFAADITVRQDGNKVTVTHDTESGANGTFMYVFDTKLEEGAEITADFVKQHLVYVTQTAEQSCDFVLPSNAPYGVYTVVIGSEELSAAKADRMVYMFRVDADEFDAAMKVINSSADEQALYGNIAAYNDNLYVVDIKAAEENKAAMYELLKAGKPVSSVASEDDIKELIKAAELVGGFSEMTADRMKDVLEERTDIFDTNSDFAGCSAETAAILANMRNSGAALNTLADINKAVYEATAVAAFNKAGADTVLTVLEGYNDVFGVDLSSSKYKAVSKKDLAKLLDYEVINSKEGVKAAFDKAVDKLYAERSSGKGGSSGGSGGSGGGSGSSGGRGGISAPITINGQTISEMHGEAGGFSDISGYDWAKSAIEELNSRKVMTGDGDGRFRPGDAITREEFVKILMTGFKINPSDEENGFTDVESGSWYEKYVAVAVSMEIVNGIADGIFGTGTYITRQDAAVMLYRTLKITETELEKLYTLLDIPDFDTVSDYAREAVDDLTRSGVVSGFEDGSFRPGENLTRAEAAKIIYECIKSL